MADVNIKNLEAGQAACDTLSSANQKVSLMVDAAAAGPFNSLTNVNPDLGSGFINELNQSLADIYSFLAQNIYPAAVAYFQPDNPGDEDVPDNPYKPGDGDDGGHQHTTPPGDGGGEKPPETEEPVLDTETPTEPITEQTLGEVETMLDDMTLGELDGFIGELVALAESHQLELDKYVEDDQYSDEIKQAILNSPYVPQEFKDYIQDLDSKVVRQIVEAILKGQCPEIFDLNPLNLGIIYTYLQQVAAEKGITVEQLLSDPQYADLLKDTLGKFQNVVDLIKGWSDLSAEEFQASMLKVYDGDSGDLPQEDSDVVRAFVDYLVEETSIPYESLLTDPAYGEVVQEASKQFGKASLFFSLSSHFSKEGMGKNVSQMFNGTNYKAFGMKEENVTSFKSEIDALAQSKNTTAEKILSDPQYADDVRDVLKNSNNCQGVGSIFKKAESSVSQNVAKNLYNTQFKVAETTATEGVSPGTNGTTTTTTTTDGANG